MPQAITELRSRLRQSFGLPSQIPRAPNGVTCASCANHCRLRDHEIGFCGTKQNNDGEIITISGSTETGHLDWYHDPLPTNCVASWVCPERASRARPGSTNLAVFYRSCTFDCLFCQNWHFRDRTTARAGISADQLSRQGITADVRCVCFFGGDPASQMEHALATGESILRTLSSPHPRICWETNGGMAEDSLHQAVGLSKRTGGVIKFDLKAHSERLHQALTGTSCQPTRANFRRLVEWSSDWQHGTPVVASSLLIPGYVDVPEVTGIARFIADLSTDIPYSLLGFSPQYAMSDLPATSVGHAERCLNAARAEGLTRVHLGNSPLLRPGVY